MKALVTGANGLIGANLVRKLVAGGHEVRAFARDTSDMRSLVGLKIDIRHGDILKPETIAEAASGCDVMFHTAAVFAYWGRSAGELRTIAVDGTVNAVEAAHRSGVGRVVLTSSSVVFGSSIRPVARDESGEFRDQDAPPYVVAKVEQELAAFRRAAELGLVLVAVCPTMTVGPHDYRLSPSNAVIVNYLADPFKITYPGGCNIVSASDVALGHIIAAESGKPGERYLLGSENLEWPAIHAMISEFCGAPGPHFRTNHTGSYLASAASEMLALLSRKDPISTRVQAKMVGRYYWYSHDRMTSMGFNPRPAREALAEAVSWLMASPHISRELRSTLKMSREVFQARQSMERAEKAEAGDQL